MGYLIVVSLIWAFSFGLIKSYLAGIDPSFVAFIRMAFALAVFLPLLRLRGLSLAIFAELTMIGALQFGLMYVAYIASFQYLPSYLVALFTIFTPIYVALLDDALGKRFHPRYLMAALCAVLAAAAVARTGTDRSVTLTGFFLVQASNVGFAVGQVWYAALRRRNPSLNDRNIFASLYAGALVITLIAWLIGRPDSIPSLTMLQWSILAYLGLIASGICFFLWNLGAQRVNAGILAVMNNLKIPLAVLVSLFVFQEKASFWRLMLSLFLILGAIRISHVRTRPSSSDSI